MYVCVLVWVFVGGGGGWGVGVRDYMCMHMCMSLCSSIHPRAACVAGVYGSSLHPDNGPTTIAIHNWGHPHPTRVERAIEVTLPASSVESVHPGRHILLHKGQIVLEDHQWSVHQLDT